MPSPRIVAEKRLDEGVAFEREMLRQAAGSRAGQQPLDPAIDRGGPVGQPIAKFPRPRQRLARLAHLVHDPRLLQCLRGERLGKRERGERLLRRKRGRQGGDCAAVGTQADPGIGHHELRIGRGDHQVAGQHDREAGAGRGAFDRGDDRLGAADAWP